MPDTYNKYRPASWVLAGSDQGTFLVNRNDHHTIDDRTYGVGHDILTRNSYGEWLAGWLDRALDCRHQQYGDGVTALDVGANIGIFTVTMARHLTGRGSVIAFEPQERVFMACCANILLNNCSNASVRLSGVSSRECSLKVPVLDYDAPASYGSLELAPTQLALRQNADLGQSLSADKYRTVPAIAIDSFYPGRIDLLKIDVEGMEWDVLAGAMRYCHNRQPIIVMEHNKSAEDLGGHLSKFGYYVIKNAVDLFAITHTDKRILGL